MSQFETDFDFEFGTGKVGKTPNPLGNPVPITPLPVTQSKEQFGDQLVPAPIAPVTTTAPSGSSRAGQAVPGMKGFVFNSAGGYEPGGAGNAVPGLTGASYGPDGYSVTNAPVGTPQTTPTTNTTTQPTGTKLSDNDFASWWQQAIAPWGGSLSSDQVKSLEKDITARGGQILTSGDGRAGKIRLPSGQVVDVIFGSGAGINKAQWLLDNGGSASGQGLDLNAIGLDDPATRQLMELVSSRIAALQTPVNDPAMADFTARLREQMGRLATPLERPQETQDFMGLLKAEMAKLQAPVFSDEQRGNMRTAAFDQLNRQEQAEIENTVRQLASRGVPPDSGIVSNAVQKVREKYISAKAQQQQQLNTYEINTIDDRRKQLLQAGQTGSTLALTQQQQDEQRKAQIVGLAQQLVEMARAARGEANTNSDKAISLAALPVDITERRIAAATNAAAGQASNPSSILATLTQLLNSGNSQTNANATNNSAYIQALMNSISQIDWSKVFG